MHALGDKRKLSAEPKTPGPSPQRKPSPEGRGGGLSLALALSPARRACGCGGTLDDHEPVQAKDGAKRATPTRVPSIVREVAGSAGQPLDASTRRFMEPLFGQDFGPVRLHTDARADRAAAAIGARAFTSGHSIAFRAGEYAPATGGGRRLLAHELTHVVQQGAGVQLGGAIGQSGDAYERQADGVAQAVAEGAAPSGTPGASGPVPAVQRADPAGETAPPAPVEAPAEDPAASDPLVIGASVGQKGHNSAADVAKVQARLVAVGLLSQADLAAESPQALSPVTAPADSTATPPTDGSSPPADVPVTAGETPSTPATSPTPVDAGPGVVADAPVVPASSLPRTIAAIVGFQQALSKKERVDGRIDPGGGTWKALCAADAASVAALKEAWEKQKQQMKEEAAKQAQLDAEQKKTEAREASEAAEKQRSSTVTRLMERYATFLPHTSTYVDLDEAGLAGALAGSLQGDSKLVLGVFDQLAWSDTDDVAYELAHGATGEALKAADHGVLERLKGSMAGGWQTAGETAEIARIDAALGKAPQVAGTPVAAGTAGPLTSAGALEDPAGQLKPPVIDGATLKDRIAQIHVAYDQYFVERSKTGNCHLATKRALENMGWTVGASDENFIQGKIGDDGLSSEQSGALLTALLAEVNAGRPVEIGVNYQAGHPGNADAATDHWLYVVAVTVDDAGQTVLVAYDNADVALSKITDGNIVLFRIDEMGQLYHGPYFPTSKKAFSTETHVVVNFRPAKRMPKP